MKHFRKILSLIAVCALATLLLCANLPASANNTASTVVGDFAPQLMTSYTSYGTEFGEWSAPETGLTVGQLHVANLTMRAHTNGYAAIRRFDSDIDGTFYFETAGLPMLELTGGTAGDSIKVGIFNEKFELVWPTNGDWCTVTQGAAYTETISAPVTAGGSLYFVATDPTAEALTLNTFGIGHISSASMADLGYYGQQIHSSGYLCGSNMSTQGVAATHAVGEWYYMYAPSVKLTTAADAAAKPVAFKFTEKELTYQTAYNAWGADDNILTGSWSNWGYVDQTYTSIRKLVMPAAGTFKIETIWGTTGVTVQNAADSFDFAILNKDKEIVWPVGGGWFKVTASTPAEVNLELPVAAGDAVYFLFKNGSAVPTPYTTASVLCIDNYETRLDNGSGGYGAADISAQGNGGWYYLYADDLTAITAADHRDMTALTTALDAAAAITDLSGYTADSAAAFAAALTAAQAITEANTQDEIDAAAAALTAAINGLTEDIPEPPLPTEDPNDPTVALQFTEQPMTYDATLSGWTADADNNCVTYPWASVSLKQNGKTAIRKFVAPIAGDLILKWGNGIAVSKGSANFVITDEFGKILYGKQTLTAGQAHVLDLVIEKVEAGDTFYFVVYNHTVDGAETSFHSAVNIDSTSCAENGNFYNSANTQGAGGWYYVYATDITEVKKSAYKSFVALDAQIAAAEAISADLLALYDETAVAAFTAALETAKALTDANTQDEIDLATAALELAIKALVPKSTPADVNKVTFTEKPLTFDAALGYWTTADDPACILTAPLNYATPVMTGNTAVVRKLIVPQDGTLELKWGNGVYIDNTSGLYTGATAEFVIADKNGRILYPQDGGAAKITEGTPLVLDEALGSFKKGDAVYFITYNPSKEYVPVVYNFAVMLNGTTSLQNAGGSLYGTADEQGSLWYFGYADDLAFSKATFDADDDQQGEGDSDATTPDAPNTGDSHALVWAAILLVLSASVLMLTFRKGEMRQ